MSAWLQGENVVRWIGVGDGIGNIYAVERSSDVRASDTIKGRKDNDNELCSKQSSAFE